MPLVDPTSRCRTRHPLLELAPNQWIFTLEDRTLLYHAESGKATRFGDRSYGDAMVRTAKGTLVSGLGFRSTDRGKNWTPVRPFPACGNYHNDLIALANGWLVATAASKGSSDMRLIISRDDGLTWDSDRAHVFYDPGRRYGNGSPHLAQLDKETLGVVFYDEGGQQPSERGIFFLRVPLKDLARPE